MNENILTVALSIMNEENMNILYNQNITTEKFMNLYERIITLVTHCFIRPLSFVCRV